MNKRIYKILLPLVIVLQIAVICYRAEEKSGFHTDEFYSFEYAKSFIYPRNEYRRITDSDEWRYETWIDSSILRNSMVVSDEDSLLNQDPLTALKLLLGKKYNYFGFLNIALSLLSGGQPDKTPGIILNLIFFILTQVVIFRITDEINENKFISLMAVVMYGSSMMAVGLAVFVRFYTMTNLIFLTVLRLHQIMRRTKSLARCGLLTVLCMYLLYTGMRNSELVFILGTGLVISYAIGVLIRKEYGKAFCYLIMVLPVSVFYIFRKTRISDVILDPGRFIDGPHAYALVSSGLLNMTPGRILQSAGSFVKFLAFQLFGSKYVFAAFCIVLTLLAGARLFEKKTEPAQKNERSGFCRILSAVVLIYFSAILAADLVKLRYMSYLYPMLTILIWAAVNFFTLGKSFRKTVLTVCTVLTCAGILSGELGNSSLIDYIYAEDRLLIRALSESGIRSAVLINDDIHSYSVSDCVYWMPDGGRVYPVNKLHHSFDLTGFPDEFLIWIHDDSTLDHYTDDLIANGYQIQKLGSTHLSNVYTAGRQ